MFSDRVDAGRRLGALLARTPRLDVVVLGLPRGGVVVAREVAQVLGAPLDVLVVRKLGVPWQPELAAGAIGEGDVRVLNDAVAMSVRAQQLAEVEREERLELQRRVALFRGSRAAVPLAGRTAVLVDDGIATGATARAACQVARAAGAAAVVLAVPVAPAGAERALREVADEVVVVEQLRGGAVGGSYRDFEQVPDSEVTRLLQHATVRAGAARHRPEPEGRGGGI